MRIDGVVTDLTSEVSRATAAETTLTNNLASEVSRATAAEQGLADDMQQLDDSLSYAISQEQSRATNAESGLQSDIDTVASDLSDFEDEVRDGYIPNAGNTKSGGLSISRDDDIDLSSTNGDVHINANTAYYNGTTADDEIATKGDVDTATTDMATKADISTAMTYVGNNYIPNGGNNKNEQFELTRSAIAIKDTNSNTLISSNNNQLNIYGLDYTQFPKITKTFDGVSHTSKVMYGNNPNDPNEEVATIGDINNATSGMATQSDLDGYVPNGGNTKSGTFSLTRDDDINLRTTQIINIEGGEFDLIGTDGAEVYADSDGWLELTGNNTMRLKIKTTAQNTGTVFDASVDDDNVIVGDQSNNSSIITYIIGGGVQPNNYKDGINVFNQRVYVKDQFTAAYDNTDSGRYGATTNKLELSNLGISGQTQHGNLVPELHYSPSTAVQPNNSLTSYDNEKVVFDLKADVNYVYEDTLEIPENANMVFNGAIYGADQTQISGDISTTPNSSLITLTGDGTNVTFNGIIFNGKNPTQSQGAIIDCAECDNIEIIFNNCIFNVTPYILKQFAYGKVVFKNCIFTANYAIQFSYAGNNAAEIIIDSCVFAGAPSEIQLNANNAGCTFIVTNNKVGAVTTNPISAFPSTVYEWNNSVVSSGYSETTLYVNTQSIYGNQNIALNYSLSDFDEIFYYFRYYTSTDNRVFTFSLLSSNIETNVSYNAGTLDGYRWDINFPDMTHAAFSTNATTAMKIEKIIGIKY